MKRLIIGISKWLLRVALDKALRRALPEIYKRLDAEMPLLITNNAPPVRVKGAIAGAISSVTGKRCTPDQIDAVIALYDPVKAAANALKRRSESFPDSFRF